MKLHEILSETRIINQDDPFGGGVRHYVESFHKGVPEIDRWLDRKLTGFLTARYRGPALDDVTHLYDGSEPPPLSPNDHEPWIDDAIRAGERIYYFVTSNHGDHHPDPDLDAQIRRILEWFEHLMQNDPPVFSRLDRITWDQAVAAEQRWHEQLAKQAHRNQSRAVLPGMEEVLKTSAGTWYRLTSAEVLDQEGKLMGHCVGSYAREVASSKTEIYSLRDDDNQPHVTIEVAKYRGLKSINQVKGKENKKPVDRYLPAVREFILHVGIMISSDGLRDLVGTDFLHHVSGKIEQIGDYEVWLTQKRPNLPRHLWSAPLSGKIDFRRGGEVVASMDVHLFYVAVKQPVSDNPDEPTLEKCTNIEFLRLKPFQGEPMPEDALSRFLNELCKSVRKNAPWMQISPAGQFLSDLRQISTIDFRNGHFTTKAQRDREKEKLERVYQARQTRKAERE